MSSFSMNRSLRQNWKKNHPCQWTHLIKPNKKGLNCASDGKFIYIRWYGQFKSYIPDDLFNRRASNINSSRDIIYLDFETVYSFLFCQKNSWIHSQTWRLDSFPILDYSIRWTLFRMWWIFQLYYQVTWKPILTFCAFTIFGMNLPNFRVFCCH